MADVWSSADGCVWRKEGEQYTGVVGEGNPRLAAFAGDLWAMRISGDLESFGTIKSSDGGVTWVLQPPMQPTMLFVGFTLQAVGDQLWLLGAGSGMCAGPLIMAMERDGSWTTLGLRTPIRSRGSAVCPVGARIRRQSVVGILRPTEPQPAVLRPQSGPARDHLHADANNRKCIRMNEAASTDPGASSRLRGRAGRRSTSRRRPIRSCSLSAIRHRQYRCGRGVDPARAAAGAGHHPGKAPPISPAHTDMARRKR